MRSSGKAHDLTEKQPDDAALLCRAVLCSNMGAAVLACSCILAENTAKEADRSRAVLGDATIEREAIEGGHRAMTRAERASEAASERGLVPEGRSRALTTPADNSAGPSTNYR